MIEQNGDVRDEQLEAGGRDDSVCTEYMRSTSGRLISPEANQAAQTPQVWRSPSQRNGMG